VSGVAKLYQFLEDEGLAIISCDLQKVITILLLNFSEWKTQNGHNPWFHYNLAFERNQTRGQDRAQPNNPVCGLIGISNTLAEFTEAPTCQNWPHRSHGCIRLTNWDALELSKMVKIGTPTILKE
jgi:hypothetical protein